MFKLTIVLCLLSMVGLLVVAYPSARFDDHALQRRTDPFFPETPASCPICAEVRLKLHLYVCLVSSSECLEVPSKGVANTLPDNL